MVKMPQNTSLAPAAQSTSFDVLVCNSSNQNVTVKDKFPLAPYLVFGRYASIIMTVVSVYILVAISIYGWRNRHKRNVPKTNKLCALCSLINVVFCLNKIGETWIGGIPCAAYIWSAASMYAVSSGLIYTILWARQRRLYSDNLLANSVGKPTKVLSALMILLIYCSFGAITMSFVTTFGYDNDVPPCVVVWHPLGPLLPIVCAFMATCFMFQCALFVLILNPLLQGKGIKAKLAFLFSNRQKNDIQKMLKRLAFCAVVCICSTLLLSVTILVDALGTVRLHWSILGAVDLVINTIATICTFGDWKQRLFPMFPCSKTKLDAPFPQSTDNVASALNLQVNSYICQTTTV